MPIISSSENLLVADLLATGQTAYYAPSASYYHASAVTIFSSPAVVTAGENPIVWTFHASALTGTSSFAELTFFFNNPPAVDDYVTITPDIISDYPIFQVTCKDEPGSNQFYSSTTTPTKNEVECAMSCVAALNDNFSFRQRFYATQNDGLVIVRAKKTGSRYNMNFFSPNEFITGDIALNYSHDAANSYVSQSKKDYSVWGDLFINSSGYLGGTIDRTDSINISSTELTYLPDNNYTFDVSNVVKNYVTTPLPTISSSTFFRTTDDMVNFYILFGEKYDEFDNNYKRRFVVGQTEVLWATNASLELTQVNDLTNYTVQSVETGQSILPMTLSPNPKEIFSNQLEFISFMYSHTPSSTFSNIYFYLKGEIEYFDGSFDIFTDTKLTSISAGGSYHVEVGYDSMGFSPSSPVRSYDVGVWIRWTDDAFSIHNQQVVNTKTYVLLQDCPSDYAYNFIFKNTLGRWDSFLFNGEIEENLERSSKQFNSPESYSPTSEDRLSTDISVNVQKKTVSKSGWLDKIHFDWLFELAKNTDVRLYNSGDLIPVVVNKVDWEMDSTKTMYQVQMDWSYAKEENYVKQ